MARERPYRDLVAWQKGMEFVVDVDRESWGWPSDQRFGLVSQVQRAAVSVPANIAEGSGRTGSAELRRFLSIAHGSLCEAMTHLEIAEKRGFMNPTTAQTLHGQGAELSRILRGFIRSLEPEASGNRSHDPRLTTHD